VGRCWGCGTRWPYIDQTGDRRLVKNGYEPGTLKRVLRERYDREHGDQIVRYMQTYRKAG
jgi:hypothetical protein